MPRMREVLLTNFSAADLFSLVLDIEKYPEFLPWCSAAKIINKKHNILIADLVISFKGFTEKYRSKVTYQEQHKIEVELIDGPFTHLFNSWQFEDIKDSKNKSRLIFEIDFSFKSKILEKLIGLIFKQAAEKLSNAFIERANNILTRSANSQKGN